MSVGLTTRVVLSLISSHWLCGEGTVLLVRPVTTVTKRDRMLFIQAAYQNEMKKFSERLTGGHPNSLGNTIEIVEEVLNDNDHFDELFNCYFSDDEVVRLRTSNAMKRIGKEKKSILIPYIDRFLAEISKIDQASTQWTLAQLFGMLESEMTGRQIEKAKDIMKHNLANHNDWIVLNQTMDTLVRWSKKDQELKAWVVPHLKRLAHDERKSVSGRAKKLMGQIK